MMRWVLALAVVFAGCQRPCGPSTCDGCCASATECVEGKSHLECGNGGEACLKCNSQERCFASQCQPLAAVDAGVVDAGPVVCSCATSCCLPDGSCAPNNDISACGANKAFCGTCGADQRCELGVCVAGACSGCVDPLGRCQQGSTVAACGSDGGVCVACGADQACGQGRCYFTRCDQNNCRYGCCQADLSCVTPSALTCGFGGTTCQSCAAGTDCIAGSCQ